MKPQPSFEQKVAEDKKKRETADAVKKQADAKAELAVAISGYQCYRTNGSGIDHSATAMVQQELRGIKVSTRLGTDFIRTLAAVRQVILELPDHPKMGDVNRVVADINARLRQ